jgi:hypothetical protein
VFGVSVVDALNVIEVIALLKKASKIRLVNFRLKFHKIDLYNLAYLYVITYLLGLILLFYSTLCFMIQHESFGAR